jgi:MFS family permease
MAVETAGVVPLVTIPLAGYLSDRFGRTRIYLLDSVLPDMFGFIYFAMLNAAVPDWIFLVIARHSFMRDCEHSRKSRNIRLNVSVRLTNQI